MDSGIDKFEYEIIISIGNSRKEFCLLYLNKVNGILNDNWKLLIKSKCIF